MQKLVRNSHEEGGSVHGADVPEAGEDELLRASVAQDSVPCFRRKTLADRDDQPSESRSIMSTGKPHEKKRVKKVRFGGDVVVATKYLEKDPKDMHTVYKLYDNKGHHVGSKRQY
jgi:hypothetical protein